MREIERRKRHSAGFELIVVAAGAVLRGQLLPASYGQHSCVRSLTLRQRG